MEFHEDPAGHIKKIPDLLLTADEKHFNVTVRGVHAGETTLTLNASSAKYVCKKVLNKYLWTSLNLVEKNTKIFCLVRDRRK